MFVLVTDLLRDHVAFYEPDSLYEASSVGAQADGIRHGYTVEARRESPAARCSSRLPIGDAPGTDLDDSFPDDSSIRSTNREPQGPVLDGLLLRELGVDEVDTSAGNKCW